MATNVSEETDVSIFRGFFYVEDDGSTFLRNTDIYLPDYTASNPKILHTHRSQNLRSFRKLISICPNIRRPHIFPTRKAEKYIFLTKLNMSEGCKQKEVKTMLFGLKYGNSELQTVQIFG
jgi:hypothetical protein